MTIRTPRFGNLLTWEVIHPGQEHATTHNGREYQIERASRETVRARFGHGGASWFLHNAGQIGFGEVDGEWEWGYPLGSTILDSKMLAELKLVCPWAIPTCTSDAPSITQILGGIGAVWDTPIGMVTCGLVTPTLIGIQTRTEFTAATVRIEFARPSDRCDSRIGCVWRVKAVGQDGSVDCGTWPEAFGVATRTLVTAGGVR